MTYNDFDYNHMSNLLAGTAMAAIYDAFMATRKEVDFHGMLDFTVNRSICIASDYSGENDQSRYYTYSFVFTTFSQLEQWLSALCLMREEKGYSAPPNYKTTKPDSSEGKFTDWIKLAQTRFKGFVVSFAVEKSIESLLLEKTSDLIRIHSEEYGSCPLGEKNMEKAYRVSHMLSLVLSQILSDGYKYLWMTDNDAIAQNDEYWNATVKIHDNSLRHYCSHLIKVTKGYATPFETSSEENQFSEDFLSLSDLYAGALDDFMNQYKQDMNPQDLLVRLKNKTVSILREFQDVPHYTYVLSTNGSKVRCRQIQVRILDNSASPIGSHKTQM
jgi:hypothetical protein